MRTGGVKKEAKVVHQFIISFKNEVLGLILEQEGKFYAQEGDKRGQDWAYGPFNSIWEAENNFKEFYKNSK